MDYFKIICGMLAFMLAWEIVDLLYIYGMLTNAEHLKASKETHTTTSVRGFGR